jgi:archaellum component FlaC
MTDFHLPNINNINVHRSDTEEEMKKICDEIAEDFFKFKKSFNMNNQILQSNYKVDENGKKILNNNFDNIELIEENLDELYYLYYKIKKRISQARSINLLIEKTLVSN